MKESILGYTSSGVGLLISAVQTNQWLGLVLAVLSIIEVLVTTGFMLYKWYKKAKEDKVITLEEIEEAFDLTESALNEIADIVNKNKDNKTGS